ncbi:MAG: NTP transferase domain-containing protein [bacterium]|nr:NTP transferase domain-containing protein [bacterium]
MGHNTDEVVGVILAAGKGSRMSPLSTRLPKPVLPILNKPIICHQLEAMRSVGIRKAYVVVGYRGFEVVRELERFEQDFDMDIEYVQQEENLGIAHCVGRLESVVNNPFFLFLGDIYFHAPRIREFMDAFREPDVDAVIGAIEEDDPALISRNFSIAVDDADRITHVVEKPRFPRTRLKGVGLYLFSPVVFDAIRRTPRTALRDEYEITDSIQIMIDYGYHVRLSLAVDRDINITYPADLLAANLWLLDQDGLPNAVSPNATVADDAQLSRAVVGAGATIGSGAHLTNCVVFQGCSVAPGESLENAIVTEDGVLRT